MRTRFFQRPDFNIYPPILVLTFRFEKKMLTAWEALEMGLCEHPCEKFSLCERCWEKINLWKALTNFWSVICSSSRWQHCQAEMISGESLKASVMRMKQASQSRVRSEVAFWKSNSNFAAVGKIQNAIYRIYRNDNYTAIAELCVSRRFCFFKLRQHTAAPVSQDCKHD